MKRRIRLVAIDIDGTLLDSRFELSLANRQAIAAAAARGVEIVLVTGRRFVTAQRIAAQLPVEALIIASNGALVKDRAGATLARRLLPRAHARAALAATGEYRNWALLLFDREGAGQIVAEYLAPRHPPVDSYLERNRESLRQIVPLEDALSEDPIEVLFAGPVEPMRALARTLEESPLAAEVSLARTEYLQRDLTLVDALAKDCNKGAALARWAGHRAIPPEAVMAIGDNWNDREMLAFAGLPVLMGNSSDELKRATGWAVTASNDESGVAAALEKFVLAG